MRRPLLALLAAVLALHPLAGSADALSDKLCPILAEIAGSTEGFVPEAVQAQLVMGVGSAYDFDPDALNEVLDGADASAEAGCPDARTAILAATGKQSLYDAMR